MFSVVIPLFNHGSTIERAVTSVLAQTRAAAEILVIDDGSTDNGAERARRFRDARVRVVRQHNQGVAVARNAGARLASSDLVALLDADDEWNLDHLEVLAGLRARFPGAMMYGTAYHKVDVLGRKIPLRCAPGEYLLEDYFATAVRYDQPMHSSSVAIDRESLLAIGGFPTGLRSGEDLLTWARLACRGDIAFSSRHTSTFYVPDVRPHGHLERARARPPEAGDIVGRELAKLANAHPTRRRSIRSYLGLWHRMRAMAYCVLGDRAACLVELRRATTTSGPRPRDAVTAALLVFPHSARGEILLRIRLMLESARSYIAACQIERA